MTQASSPVLIAADWGTTSLRCYLVDAAGNVLARRQSGQGILRTGDLGFAEVIADQAGDWLDRDGLPVLLSGMIGSRQGWHEAPYLRCPASPRELAGSLLRVETDHPRLSRHPIRIVAGMDTVDSQGVPDVMRGEEAQVLGAMLSLRLREGVFVLPGTHSKWVSVADGAVSSFRTFMTGELFSALMQGTILGRLAEGDVFEPAGFELGVETAGQRVGEGGPGDLLNMVFSARTRVLAGGMPPMQVHSYLSGLLIGAEIAAALTATAAMDRGTKTVHIIAGEMLGRRYVEAARLLGKRLELAADDAVVHAHLAIARAAGLIH